MIAAAWPTTSTRGHYNLTTKP